MARFPPTEHSMDITDRKIAKPKATSLLDAVGADDAAIAWIRAFLALRCSDKKRTVSPSPSPRAKAKAKSNLNADVRSRANKADSDMVLKDSAIRVLEHLPVYAGLLLSLVRGAAGEMPMRIRNLLMGEMDDDPGRPRITKKKKPVGFKHGRPTAGVTSAPHAVGHGAAAGIALVTPAPTAPGTSAGKRNERMLSRQPALARGVSSGGVGS